MHKVSGIILSILTLFLFSCSEKNQFPEKKSVKLSLTAVKADQTILKNVVTVPDSLASQSLNDELQQLKKFIGKYENRDPDFSLETMESLWETVNTKSDVAGLERVSAWIETSGFLLEITGKPKYAAALQQLTTEKNIGLNESDTKTAGQRLMPYIFTKDVDHIFVNIFVNSSVEYDHSLGGKIKVTQELTGSNSLLLKFSTTEKRYIEVHILIPEEAQNATVTEKNVKYVATPGEYCLIARKWKEGDMVEIKY